MRRMSGASLLLSRVPNHSSTNVPGVTCSVMSTPGWAAWYRSANERNDLSEPVVFQELNDRLTFPPNWPLDLAAPETLSPPQAARARPPAPTAPLTRNCLLSIGRSKNPNPTSSLPGGSHVQTGDRTGGVSQLVIRLTDAPGSLVPFRIPSPAGPSRGPRPASRERSTGFHQVVQSVRPNVMSAPCPVG